MQGRLENQHSSSVTPPAVATDIKVMGILKQSCSREQYLPSCGAWSPYMTGNAARQALLQL